MDAEFFPEKGERLDVAKAVDIDRGDLAVVEMACQPGEIRDLTLLDTILVLLDDMDRGPAGFSIDEMGGKRGG